MKLKMLISGVAAILVSGVVFFSGDLLFAYNVEEYYPLNEDDRWVYIYKSNENGEEETSQEVAKIKGSETIGEVEAKKMLSVKFDNRAVAIDLEGVKLFKSWGWSGGDYEVYQPAKILFPNMEKGESKTFSVESAAHNIDDAVVQTTMKSGTMTVTLEAVEDVEVPAGIFKDCLKFVSIYEYAYPHRPASGKETSTVWLAPGSGVVKAEYNNTELNTENNKEDKISESVVLSEGVVNGRDLKVPLSSAPAVEEALAPQPETAPEQPVETPAQ